MMIVIVICVCCVHCILDDVFAPQCSRSQRTTFGSRFFLFTVESGNWIQDFRFAKQVPLSTLSTRPPHLPERGLWWWLCDYVNVLNVTHWGTHFKRLIVISIFHMLFLIRKPLQSGMARYPLHNSYEHTADYWGFSLLYDTFLSNASKIETSSNEKCTCVHPVQGIYVKHFLQACKPTSFCSQPAVCAAVFPTPKWHCWAPECGELVSLPFCLCAQSQERFSSLVLSRCKTMQPTQES